MNWEDDTESCWYRCAACGQLMCPSFSGDVYGGQQWTDGFLALEDDSLLIPIYQCPSCQALGWLRPSIIIVCPVGTIRPPVVESPAENTLLDAIDQGFARDPAEEFIARRLAWWRTNDPWRVEERLNLPLPGDMEWLLNRAQRNRPTGDSAYRRVEDFMEVELLRNLQRFDEAKERLAAIWPAPNSSEWRTMAPGIFLRHWRGLCEAESPHVQRL